MVAGGEGEAHSGSLGGGKSWVLPLRSREFLSSYSSLSIVSIYLHTLLFVNTV
jgi:hypothetical protein